jgi:hypothetical protein
MWWLSFGPSSRRLVLVELMGDRRSGLDAGIDKSRRGDCADAAQSRREAGLQRADPEMRQQSNADLCARRRPVAGLGRRRQGVGRPLDRPGRTFTPPVAVNQKPLELDWGPDARPKIAVDRDGRIFGAFAIFKDKAFNGQGLYTRSTDSGRTFAPPVPITANTESQCFEGLALDADGALFAAWLDKRNRVPAKARNETYVGAALAFAWSNDHGATVSDTRIAQDHTCECCRLGIAFAGPGRPVIAFRNVFDGTVRDHAVMTFADRSTPGPVYRISVDDWKTDACPHHGPSLALSAAGTYHVTWFTSGTVR